MPSADLSKRSAGKVIFAAALLATMMQPALAEKARRSPHKSQPVPQSRTAPDVTATIPPSKTPAPAANEADEPLTPYNLPAAPRARMRACGQKWQEVKMSGGAGDETWRDFATRCLTQNAAAGK